MAEQIPATISDAVLRWLEANRAALALLAGVGTLHIEINFDMSRESIKVHLA